jgi:phage baseplate assembly protein W
MVIDFLGSGWAFPVQPDRGRIRQASGEESVQQSIRIILSTAPGERVMRPDFGCRIREYVFALNNASTIGAATRAVREALAQWEPRIDLIDVRAATDPMQPRTLLVEIDYRLRSSNSRANLVFPLYLG